MGAASPECVLVVPQIVLAKDRLGFEQDLLFVSGAGTLQRIDGWQRETLHLHL